MNSTQQTFDNAIHIMEAVNTLHSVLHKKYKEDIEEHYAELQQVDDVHNACRDNNPDGLDLKIATIRDEVREVIEKQNPQHKMKEALNEIFSQEGLFVDKTSFDEKTARLPEVGFCARFGAEDHKRLCHNKYATLVDRRIPKSKKYAICVDVYKKFKAHDDEDNLENNFENNYTHIAVLSFLKDNPDEVRVQRLCKEKDGYGTRDVIFSEWHLSLCDNEAGFFRLS